MLGNLIVPEPMTLALQLPVCWTGPRPRLMVGDSHLNIPLPGHQPDSLGQRAALALIRMVVFGSASALAGRGGVFIELDEAWTFLDGGAGEMDRLGRVARSQQVLPCLSTQRVTDALNARLEGYISRLAIGPITDPDEARAACQLAKLDPATYLERITTPGTSAVQARRARRRTGNPCERSAIRSPATCSVGRCSCTRTSTNAPSRSRSYCRKSSWPARPPTPGTSHLGSPSDQSHRLSASSTSAEPDGREVPLG